MESSGADRGFFQSPPVLGNQFHDDESFQRCFHLFLSPKVVSETYTEVASLGDEVISDQIFTWISDAEHNKPRLKGSGRDAFGNWKGELITSEGWRNLQDFGIAKGFVAAGYDTDHGAFARPLQFLRLHLWEASSANVTCPSAMQDGAARLLQLHLTTPRRRNQLSAAQQTVFEDAFRRLTSRKPGFAWTSGQWMTERTGGSDVSLTETTAVFDPGTESSLAGDSGPQLGPWSINGFKWFSSATDSQMAVLLARTSKGGLSAFFAPMRKRFCAATTGTGLDRARGGTVLNGVKIQRLKNKFGTQPLPTAELVLENMRGWRIGEDGRGIQEISTVLTLTRVHSAVAAVGYVGRSLAIAKAYARVREIGAGRGERMKLTDSPLHMRTLATMTVEYRGLMLLTFFAAYLLGLSEHPQPPGTSASGNGGLSGAQKAFTPSPERVMPLLRVLTPLTKAYVCRSAVQLIFSCMECLGGLGYLINEESEYLNLARLYRDCAVLPIWEGTTDVLCTDFLRALKHPQGGADSLQGLDEVLRGMRQFATRGSGGLETLQRWEAVKTKIKNTDQKDLMRDGRQILWEVADLLIGGLLGVDANRGDGDEGSRHVLDRHVGAKTDGTNDTVPSSDRLLLQDVEIVFGTSKQHQARL